MNSQTPLECELADWFHLNYLSAKVLLIWIWFGTTWAFLFSSDKACLLLLINLLKAFIDEVSNEWVTSKCTVLLAMHGKVTLITLSDFTKLCPLLKWIGRKCWALVLVNRGRLGMILFNGKLFVFLTIHRCTGQVTSLYDLSYSRAESFFHNLERMWFLALFKLFMNVTKYKILYMQEHFYIRWLD